MIDFDGTTKKLRDIDIGDTIITYDPYSNQYIEDSIHTSLHYSHN